MRKLLFSASLCILCTIAHPVFSQRGYSPDTSLTFDVFLNQCINFKKQVSPKVWVINFWASNNSSSIFQLDGLKHVHTLYDEEVIRFVSISEDESAKNWAMALKHNKMNWEHLRIPKGEDLTYLKRAFRYTRVPAYFIVNTQGKIRPVAGITRLREILESELGPPPDNTFDELKESSNFEDIYTMPSNSVYEDSNPYSSYQDPDPVIEKPVVTREEPVYNPSRPVSSYPRENSYSYPSDIRNDNALQGEWITHKVQPGETLYRMYVKYKVPVAEIKRINGLSDNTIKTGQVLKIKRK